MSRAILRPAYRPINHNKLLLAGPGWPVKMHTHTHIPEARFCNNNDHDDNVCLLKSVFINDNQTIIVEWRQNWSTCSRGTTHLQPQTLRIPTISTSPIIFFHFWNNTNSTTTIVVFTTCHMPSNLGTYFTVSLEAGRRCRRKDRGVGGVGVGAGGCRVVP